MWVFLSDAMLSIVADANDPTRLLVRARLPGDVQAVFPEAKVEVTPERDYRFRASIDRGEVMCAIADRLFEIDYPNFKDSVRDRARHDAYLGVWSVMYRAQRDAIPRARTGSPLRGAPSSCGLCDFDESDGSLIQQCDGCRIQDEQRAGVFDAS